MEFDSDLLIYAILFAVAAGGIAYVFIYPLLSGEKRADKRQQTIKGGNTRQTSSRMPDLTNRRKQVEGTLKEVDNKAKKGKVSLRGMIDRAGLTWEFKEFLIFSAIMAVVVAAGIYFITRNIYIAVPSLIVGGVGLPRWVLGFLFKRRVKKFIDGFPDALDVITRGIKSGLPLGDCLRIIAVEASEPLKTEFRKVVESQGMGLTVPEAIERMADRVPVTETNFFSIVVTIQAKAGGNLSEALGNLSKVLRDRKKMRGKVQAMASEAKASGGIIAGLPFAVALLVYLSSPEYVSRLWTTDMGKMALVGAAFWMSIGIMVMKKMINFEL